MRYIIKSLVRIPGTKARELAYGFENLLLWYRFKPAKAWYVPPHSMSSFSLAFSIAQRRNTARSIHGFSNSVELSAYDRNSSVWPVALMVLLKSADVPGRLV
jgi:hypothetical protein